MIQDIFESSKKKTVIIIYWGNFGFIKLIRIK